MKQFKYNIAHAGAQNELMVVCKIKTKILETSSILMSNFSINELLLMGSIIGDLNVAIFIFYKEKIFKSQTHARVRIFEKY